MTDINSTTHGYNDMDLVLPKTATKPIAVPKKRGRPGNQIAALFRDIPAAPVDFIKFCKSYDLKPSVVRQVKRHDSCAETGRAFVRKCKDNNSEAYGTMQIWRDPNQISPWLLPKDK